jgi:hypothetical protein
LLDPQVAQEVAARYGVTPDAVFPAAPLQAGLYFQSLFEGAGDADPYTAQHVFEFDSRLDVARLERACATLLDRHPFLRAGLVGDGVPQPVQVVLPAATVPVEEITLTALGHGGRRAAGPPVRPRRAAAVPDRRRPPAR